jgi:hypothetical protein
LYWIDPKYAECGYNLLPEKKFDILGVQEVSEGAETARKGSKHLASANTDVLMGAVPSVAIYNA